ncbi:MAG: ATP-binding protein [Thermaceae bacterium]|nr:ATP-binding protein [Thermaceae bacterium]
MSAALEQLETWMQSRENERLEFKEAKNNFHFEKLVKYCCALANERGGKIILGVGNKMPRQVVGTSAFENRLNELQQVLPQLSEDAVQRLVRDLKDEGEIYKKGHTRGARWYPSP